MVNMLKIKPQGVLGYLADVMMLPIMYLLQGTFKESPQGTHRWNNKKITSQYTREKILNYFPLITFSGDAVASKRWLLGFIPLFHMPIFGGTRTFVVLEPSDFNGFWFVGWYLPGDNGLIGVSRVPLGDKVRLTIGPDKVSFFAVSLAGKPLQLSQVGMGKIGKAGDFAEIPLL